MEIRVSEKEVQETAELLDLLKRWKKVTNIGGDYNRGEVIMKIDGNNGRETLGYSIDRYCVRNAKTGTALQKATVEIEMLLADRCETIAHEVCKIIRRHMPLPVSE